MDNTDRCEVHTSSETLKGRGNSEYAGVDGRIILKWILRKQCGVVDKILLA
jgi:hypothetical protein